MTRAGRARIWAFAAVLALLPLAAVLAHRAYAVALFLLALIAASSPAVWRAGRALVAPPFDLRRPGAAALAAFGAFCLWTALSALWSPTPGAAKLAVNVAAPLAAVFATALFVRGLSAEAARRIGVFFLAGSLGSLALLGVEAASGGAIRGAAPPADLSPGGEMDMIRLGRGFTAMLPGLFGALMVALALTPETKRARRRFVLVVFALFALAFLIALGFPIAANAAALVAGAGAALFALFAPRAAIFGLAALGLALLALAPLIFAYAPFPAMAAETGLPVSWLQRLHIWRAAGEGALDCLPWGCGADYARAVAAEGVTISLPGAPAALPVMPIHPHNVFLQIGLELGLPGVVCAGVAFFSGARLLAGGGAENRATAAAAAGLVACLLVSAMVEASLWQVWRLSAAGLGALGIAISIKVRNNLKHNQSTKRREQAPTGGAM